MKTMIRLDLTKFTSEAATLIDALALDEKTVRLAMAWALTKTIRQMRTAIIKEVAAETRAKQKTIKQRTVTRESNTQRLSSKLTMYAASIPLTLYGYKVLRKGGVSSRRGRFKKAFFREDVPSSRGARDKIFERQSGAGRYPLFERRVAILDDVVAAFSGKEDKVFELFHEKFIHELRYRGGLLG